LEGGFWRGVAGRSSYTPPRAQIDNAARTYYWKNLRTFGLIGLVIVILLLFGWIAGRRRAQRRGWP
jgi:hypothetical protein